MPTIDLAFDLEETTIPLDYAYSLFGAISRIIPMIHGDRRIGVHPIRGMRLAPQRLTLVPQSRLRLRLPSEEIGIYLPLAGSRLELDGARLRVGIPRVETLTPASTVKSRLVTIGHHQEFSAFAGSLRRQMSSLGLVGELVFPPSPDLNRKGEPSRRVLRIKGRTIVGFEVVVSGLTAEGSLSLQERGLGSTRRMGCGLFVARQTASQED